MVADHTTQNVYIADSYNHQIRRIDLTDRKDIIVEKHDSFWETLGKILHHNLMLITIVVIGTAVGCCCCYMVCKRCFLCPLYQQLLHEHRVATMRYGERL